MRVHAPGRARRVREQRAGLRSTNRRAHARLHQRSLRVRLTVLVLVALALTACESNQERSAKLAKAAKQQEGEAAKRATRARRALTITRPSTKVKVIGT